MISNVPSPDKLSSSHPAPFDKGWVPKDYIGPVALPGTGRIAIGLRYAPPERVQH